MLRSDLDGPELYFIVRDTEDLAFFEREFHAKISLAIERRQSITNSVPEHSNQGKRLASLAGTIVMGSIDCLTAKAMVQPATSRMKREVNAPSAPHKLSCPLS